MRLSVCVESQAERQAGLPGSAWSAKTALTLRSFLHRARATRLTTTTSTFPHLEEYHQDPSPSTDLSPFRVDRVPLDAARQSLSGSASFVKNLSGVFGCPARSLSLQTVEHHLFLHTSSRILSSRRSLPTETSPLHHQNDFSSRTRSDLTFDADATHS